MVEENSTQNVENTTTETSTQNQKAQTLTKRNEDFMFQLKKHLTGKLPDEQLDVELTKIKNELLAGQLTGKTAKQLYGTPSEAVSNITHPKKNQARPNGSDAGYLAIALDNGLLFLAMFALLFGFFLLFNNTKADLTQAPYGILSLILTAVTGGLIFAYIQELLVPNPKKPKKSIWYRLIAVILAIIVWMVIYMGVALIPRAVNPILPGGVYIVIAVVSFVARIFERSYTGISGGVFDSQKAKK